jgi:cytochrome c551
MDDMNRQANSGALLKLLICLALLFTAAACGGGDGGSNGTAGGDGQAANPLADDGTHTEAKTVFKQNCIGCHAKDLSGAVGKNSDIRQVGARLTPEEIADVIRNGGERMPRFGARLTDEEIAALAAWLGELK